MRTISLRLAVLTGLFTTITTADFVHSQADSVLDPSSHPSSPDFIREFKVTPLPIDTRLSWKKRFNGNEEFNEAETLPPRSDFASDNLPDHPSQANSVPSENATTDATGVVVKVIPDQEKIKIKHGPVEHLGMPAMTMLFKVNDVTLLENLAKGDEISFSVNSSSSGYVISDIELKSGNAGKPTGQSESGQAAPDATGIVKSILENQGKIKIQHEPIERLGMPAMTMVFKVANPELLMGVKKGGKVEFSIDNSSGGFVITDLKTVE